MIDEKIDLIIGKLQDDFSDVAVEGFPDTPGNYALRHPAGALLVRYVGGNFQRPESFVRIFQHGEQNFGISVVMRNLRPKRDVSGIYDRLDAVRASLTGFQFSNKEILYPVSEGFVDEDNGIWTYEMIFTAYAVNTQED